MKSIDAYFGITAAGSDIKKEAIAGATTFITMAYIIIVHPKIMEAAGIPFGASMVATILSAFFGTLSMGLYAKRPFAIAPYMGENAFIAFTVVKVLGFSWQQALAAIFISGVLFTLITLFKVRGWLAKAIPESLKIAFTVGIGFFLTFIGLNETGMVTIGVPGAPVHVGKLLDPHVLLAVAGFILIGVLMIRRIKAAILIGILIITFLSIVFGFSPLPKSIVSMPPSLAPVFMQMDFRGVFSWGFFPIILTVLVMDFVDTMGTLIGVSYKAGLLDKNGDLPEIEKPMLCDAVSTMLAAVLGTTTAGAFIESATGVEAGGRTGLTAVFTAFFFLMALFLAPLFSIIPSIAYGPALIIVGMLMFSPVVNLKFNDLTEVIPVFTTIILMSFTYNMGVGMTSGFVIYPLLKVLSGKYKQVSGGMWILFAASVLFFIFYPY